VIIEAKDRIYLHDVLHMKFTLTYSGELVAGIPHGKGKVSYLQDKVHNNEFFLHVYGVYLPMHLVFVFTEGSSCNCFCDAKDQI
jgi:hypothetical protein